MQLENAGPKNDSKIKKSSDVKKSPKLKMNEKWFDSQFNDVSKEPEYDKSLIKKYENQAEELLNREIERFEKRKQNFNAGEANWLNTVSMGGTVGDKIAALVVQIYQNPLTNLAKIKMLISKVDKSNRRESLMTAETFRDLCAQNLLPDRKLVPFKCRPLSKIDELSSGNRKTVEKRLIYWYFEDQLKISYETFVTQLEKITHDTVDNNRIKAIGILTDLLINKPEQEQFLLTSIVNKLGDPSTKVASKTVHFLCKLVENHANMSKIIVMEVKKLIFRLHISSRAQYYCIVFLSQIKLRRVIDEELSSQLINIYFNLFKLLVEKGAVDNKIMALLLRGTNKAFSVAKSNASAILDDVDTLYKVAAVGNMNTSLQAMLLLHQVLETSEGVNDRFYCSLYRKLLDPSLESGTHHYPLLFHVLYKTFRSDVVDERILAFFKRLLQISLYTTPHFACAVLILISEIVKNKPNLLKFDKLAQKIDNFDYNNDQKSDDVINDNDDEERFVDVHGPESDFEQEKSDNDENDDEKPKKKPSWIHKNHFKANSRNKFEYDPNHRNPIFANASVTLLYELCILKQHYHPSVALFASKILNQESIDYSGDPLQDFTLIRFLDRFAYRNPKKRPSGDQKSAQKRSKRSSYCPWGVKNLAVTSSEYAKTSPNEIPADEQFLHKYMVNYGNSNAENDEDDRSSVNSDDFNEMLESGKLGFRA